MTSLRPASLFAALVTVALVTTLTTAPAAARTLDEVEQPEVTSAVSGVITGRVLIEPVDDGPPVAANAGEVRLYDRNDPSTEPVGFALLSSSGTFSIAGLPAGQYLASFSSFDTRAIPVREWFNDKSNRLEADAITLLDGVAFAFGDVLLEQRTIVTERLFGPNRFATAESVSQRYLSAGAFRDVVIVNGSNFPDALGAGPIASRAGGPLLMVTQNSIPAETAAELDRINPRTITIVGGTGVVSASVEAQLVAYVFEGEANVRRIAGANRYATSRAIVEALDAERDITELFVATGRGFPDALAAVPAASYVGGAVLLVDGARSSLDASTAAFINGLDVPVTLVGGTGVVSAGIQSQLTGLGVDTARVSGSNRYATAIAIAVEYFPTADSAYLANAFGFADALAIGPWAGNFGFPVYLTQPNCVTDAVFDDLIVGLFTRVTLVGGTGVLSSNVESIIPCNPNSVS